MAVEYTLTITNLQTLPEYQGCKDIVWAVGWTYSGTDGTYTMNVTGTTPVNLDLGCDVTPYKDLAENIVMAWVMRDTDPAVWVSAQQQITAWLQEQYAQTAVTLSLPWQ